MVCSCLKAARFPPTMWRCGSVRRPDVAADALTFAIAPTASLAGGVQIVARVIETGLHKMDTIGFDVKRVVSAMGTAPLAPTARSDVRAIGRTNDCILYGGQARYTVKAEDAELAELVERLPASASADYGTPFYDIFKRYDSDFYKIDPMLFSPAEVWLTSATSGRTFHAGRINPDVLRKSLYAPGSRSFGSFGSFGTFGSFESFGSFGSFDDVRNVRVKENAMKIAAVGLMFLTVVPALAQRPSDPALIVPQTAPLLDYVAVPDPLTLPDGCDDGRGGERGVRLQRPSVCSEPRATAACGI